MPAVVLIAERNLDELRCKIDLATKPGGPNIVSLNLRPQHLEELQSIVSMADISPAKALTIANMRSLGVTAIEATCECGFWCKQLRRGIIAAASAWKEPMMLCIDKLFKGRHFDREIIILCVRWYLRFKLSFRDLVEMMAERGIDLAHTTILRWI